MRRLLLVLIIGIVVALAIGFISNLTGRCARTGYYGSMHCSLPWR
jgi:hypothetical protein